MAISKSRLILAVSEGTGSQMLAASHLGIHPRAMRNWKVDAEGRVRSRRVVEAAIAAIVRARWQAVAEGREPYVMSERDERDLLDFEGLES